MSISDKRWDAAVIGGGLAGLAASVYLAKAGLSVVLLEKSNELGGRARTMKKGGGLLNMGVHAFYQDGAGELILKELGIELKGANPPPSAVAVRGGSMYPLPAGPMKLLTSKLFSASGKMGLARLMMKLGSLNTGRFPPDLSLRDWVESEFHDPIVREVIYSVCRSNSFVPHPELQLAGPAVRQLQRTFGGKAFYVDGGWASLVRELEETAKRLGVVILTGKPVKAIERSGEMLRVRLANDETMDVRSVVATAAPAQLYNMLEDAEKTSVADWNRRIRPMTGASLDLVLRRLPSPRRDFVAGFWLDRPIFYNNPTSVARMSEDGSVVVHLIKHLGLNRTDPKADERELETAMDLVQPGWRPEETARQFLPKMTVAYRFQAIDNNSIVPGPKVPEIDGLYVAGDWTCVNELLADAALASAKRAALAVIRERT